MSERKVLNKYYPPDFDPSKLPRLKREKNRQFTIRLMAPFNMRCKTCGEYIYRGKKFNARKEDVIGKTFLGIQVYRFYIKCTKCLAEITFLTDPESQDYQMEYGAIRNFESLRLAEKQAENEAKQKKEEEENNPMKILENRTRDSRREMAVLETLEDLKELNAANAHIDTAVLFKDDEELKRKIEEMQREEDEEEIRQIFGGKSKRVLLAEEIVGEVEESDSDYEDQDSRPTSTKKIKSESESKKEEVKFNEEIRTSNSTISKAVQQLAQSNSQSSTANKFSKSHLSLLVKKKPDIEIKKEAPEKLMPPPPVPPMTHIVANPLGSLASYGSDDDDDE